MVDHELQDGHGPFVTRADALEPAHTMTETLGCRLLMEVTPRHPGEKAISNATTACRW
jgi:hypothetical protein